ncbi:NigD1/NigD2 family lipoprotein [Alkaliflexus imshenetskii]|uniref:NigD1/NigD2 family lipoprotein n=1 Tax=Alkaliflexus imshenetskii TaxID=286730 RepID=UPI00047C41BD|nr:NigD-like C-terminal domain-containing protein [Alkaliflexus imshenetskii]
MCRRYLFSLLILFSALLASCSIDNDAEVYYLQLGVVKGNSASTFMIETDGGKILRPVQYPMNYEISAGKRVLVRYALVSTVEDQVYDHTVRIESIQNVLTKNLIHANETVRDTIGNDPVRIVDAWISKDYLNVEFIFWGYNKPHYFDLVFDSEKQDKPGFIALDFHHNMKNDLSYSQFRGLISFSIEELQDEQLTSIKVLFRAKDDSFKSKELTYKYVDEETN